MRGEEHSLQAGTESEKGAKKSRIRLTPSHPHGGERDGAREGEGEGERCSAVLPALCLFGVSCFSDSATSSMELEPERFST